MHNGGRVHYVIVSRLQWKPFWLATPFYPKMTWLGGKMVWTMTCAHMPHYACIFCLFVVRWRTPRGSWRSMAGLKQHSALLTLSSLISSSHSHLHMYSYPAICKHTLILVLEWMKILDSLVFGCPFEQAYVASKCNAEHSFCPSSGSCRFCFVSSVCVTLSVVLYLVIVLFLETFSPFLLVKIPLVLLRNTSGKTACPVMRGWKKLKDYTAWCLTACGAHQPGTQSVSLNSSLSQAVITGSLPTIIQPWTEGMTPPLYLSFWSFLTFLHHGIEEVERHLLWKFHEKIQRKSWSNVPPKLLACIKFLYKVVHKNGHLRKFNHAREIEFNFFIAWTIFMKLGTLVHHVHGYKTVASDFLIFAWGLSYGLSKSEKRGKIVTITKSLGKN